MIDTRRFAPELRAVLEIAARIQHPVRLPRGAFRPIRGGRNYNIRPLEIRDWANGAIGAAQERSDATSWKSEERLEAVYFLSTRVPNGGLN